MQKIKDIIRYSYLVVYLRILFTRWIEARVFAKELFTYNLRNDPLKMRADLIIRAHALEKGMSIGNGRLGFGIPKAISLIDDIRHFVMIGGSLHDASEFVSIIEKYLEFNKNNCADMNKVESKLENLKSDFVFSHNDGVGIRTLHAEDVAKMSQSSFDKFSQSRYSNRDFGKDPVNLESIKKALKLCERTPSACNRQSQRVHIFMNGEAKDNLCIMQNGCNGFSQDMQGVILVCGDLNMYGFHELNQVYVDGGLYAMNLMYALHFYGIANIPLTMAHKAHHIQKIRKAVGIPKNEMPVLLIGIGSYKQDWKVAMSKRNDWKEYVKFHN